MEINPATAKDLGLAEGGAAVLSTPKGSARVKVHLFDGIMPGLVAMPRGLGHTAYDTYPGGQRASTSTRSSSPVEDPGSGFEAGWGIRANLTRA